MKFEEALRIKNGDILYTHSGNIVVVHGWHQNFDNSCVKDDLYFHCINSMLIATNYRYDELCGPELCDEDKMFIDWCNKNDIIEDDNISQLKSSFLHGFYCGSSHKMRNKSEEQLQK
jgi:hypothetical protein